MMELKINEERKMKIEPYNRIHFLQIRLIWGKGKYFNYRRDLLCLFLACYIIQSCDIASSM